MRSSATRKRAQVGDWWSRLALPVRYAVAGIVTQVIYLTVLGLVLVAGLHYLLAIAVAQVVAITFAFPVYRRRVFAAHAGGSVLRELVAFLAVWCTGAAMSFVGVPLLVEFLGVPPFGAQLVVLLAVVSFSFLAHRGFTFAAPRGAAPEVSSAAEAR